MSSNERVVVTFKGNMSRPWIVLHADSVEDYLVLKSQTVDDPNFMESVLAGEAAYTSFVPRTPDQLVQQELGGVPMPPEPIAAAPAAPPWGAPAQAAPQAAYGAPAAPAGNGRSCVHGPMTLKEGQSSRGGWAAWMCNWGDKAAKCQPVDAVTGRDWPRKG